LLFSNPEARDQKIKKLMEDQQKILNDTKRFYDETKPNETDQLKRRIKDLEGKIKNQKPAEKPYESNNNVRI
jgi:hypothetical protein